jgi:hypothetical protein
MSKRTTHRDSKGTKLYAVRDKKGQFKDVQSYKLAHGSDIKRTGATEKQKDSAKELRESSRRFSKAMSALAKR